MGARIIETRKTVPGLRVLDKWAVLIGGGANHRMGLFDMVMIKNNHVDAAGGISPAVRACTVRKRTCELGRVMPHQGGTPMGSEFRTEDVDMLITCAPRLA